MDGSALTAELGRRINLTPWAQATWPWRLHQLSPLSPPFRAAAAVQRSFPQRVLVEKDLRVCSGQLLASMLGPSPKGSRHPGPVEEGLLISRNLLVEETLQAEKANESG